MSKCYFCKYKIEPDYKDANTLERFLTLRKKIVASEKSRICARHQRKLSKQIKHARFLSLLPYTSYQNDNNN